MKAIKILAVVMSIEAMAVGVFGEEEAKKDESGNTNEIVNVSEILRMKYERDMKTESGRSWWHGKRVSYTADPSNEVAISVYEDGKRFVDKARILKPIDAARIANKKLKTTVTKGVPKKLAEARKRRIEEKTSVTNITVEIKAGEK